MLLIGQSIPKEAGVVVRECHGLAGLVKVFVLFGDVQAEAHVRAGVGKGTGGWGVVGGG